jgi:hypothetical protein
VNRETIIADVLKIVPRKEMARRKQRGEVEQTRHRGTVNRNRRNEQGNLGYISKEW